MTKKTYVFMLSEEDRKRHERLIDKGEIVEFVVQYESIIFNKWVPIVRYDTSHGYAHKDLMKPDGNNEKIFIGSINFKDALALADRDINENWNRYKEIYLRRWANDKRRIV